MPESIANKPQTFLLHVYGEDRETGTRVPRATLAAVPVGKDSIRYAVAMCSSKDQFSKKIGRLIAEGRLVHSLEEPSSVVGPHVVRLNGRESQKCVGSISLDDAEKAWGVAQLFETIGCHLPSHWSKGPIIWDIADMSFKKYIGLLRGKVNAAPKG